MEEALAVAEAAGSAAAEPDAEARAAHTNSKIKKGMQTVCLHPFLCNVAQKWCDGSGASGFAPRPGAEFAAAVVLPIQAVFAGKLQTALVAVPLLELAGQVA